MKSFSNYNLVVLFLHMAPINSQDDPNASACVTLQEIISLCESLTPGFTAFTNFNFQAPCLCYSSTYWNPDIYDHFIQSCYAGYRTGNPSAYSAATKSNGGDLITTPCHKVGNILSLQTSLGSLSVPKASPSTSTPVSTPTSTDTITTPTNGTISGVSTPDPYRSACQTIAYAEAFCESKSPSFGTLTDFRSRAPCFCYSGLVYSPGLYDSAWGSCLKYLSTADMPDYTKLSVAGYPVLTTTPCAAVGDVLDIRSSSEGSSTTKSSLPSSQSAAKPSSTVQAVATPTTPAVATTARINGVVGGYEVCLYHVMCVTFVVSIALIL